MNFLSLLDINPLELPSVSSTLLETLPCISAVYFVVVNDVVMYIGKSKDLNNRWCLTEHHIKNSLNTEFYIHWLSMPTSKLNFAEQLLIEIHEPKLNKCKPIGNKNYVYTEKDLTDAFYLGYNKGLIKGIQLGKANTNLEVIKALDNQLKIRDIDKSTLIIVTENITDSDTTIAIDMSCTHCNSSNVKKNGAYNGSQKYLCNDCKKSWTDNILEITCPSCGSHTVVKNGKTVSAQRYICKSCGNKFKIPL